MVHSLRTLFATLADLLLPRRAEVKLVAKETPAQFSRFFLPHHYGKTTALAHYQEAPVRAAIHATKFYHDRHAAKLLACLLDRYVAELPTNTILVPLPLTPGRQRERGHNQIVTVLSYCTHPLARNYQLLLQKSKDTPPQSHLSRQERLHNIHDCFSVTSVRSIPEDVEILVVDDVVTTGTTLTAAVSTLKRTYPQCTVRGLALAH